MIATRCVDVRSASRYGRHDFGTNASRIRSLLEDIDDGDVLLDQRVIAAPQLHLVADQRQMHLADPAFADAMLETAPLVVAGCLAPAASLSGGNLQKFIVGREITLAPKVMVVAQPTWGVDIGASMLIRQSLVDLRDRGVAQRSAANQSLVRRRRHYRGHGGPRRHARAEGRHRSLEGEGLHP